MLSKALNIILVVLLVGYAAYFIYKLPKYKKGEQAPEFEAQIMNGSLIKLSDFSGKYVLLDFWGSWCGPCRRESPDLVSLYNKYGTKEYANGEGLVMISVAIEQDERSWKQAIKTDKLNWQNHIYQVGRFNSPIAKLYGVREIPTKYFIGPSGNIILTNPTFEEINSFLADNLK